MNQSPSDKDKEATTENRAKSSEPLMPFKDSGQTVQNPQITNGNKEHGESEKKISWPSWIQAMAAIAIVGITFFYTFYASQQVEQTRRTVDAMKDQVIVMQDTVKIAKDSAKAGENSMKDTLTQMKKQSRAMQDANAAANHQIIVMTNQLATMQKQLELTDRPWIKVDLETIGPLKFSSDNTQFNLDMRIRMKNIGGSVATKVRYSYETFLIRVIDAILDPLKHQKIILDKLSSTKPDELEEGESIFPNDEIWFWGGAGTAVTIEASGDNRAKIANILPIVVGCVEYQFGSSPDRHYTCFNYTVVRLDPLKNITRGVIHVGEDLPAENVRLDPHNWGGRLAN